MAPAGEAEVFHEAVLLGRPSPARTILVAGPSDTRRDQLTLSWRSREHSKEVRVNAGDDGAFDPVKVPAHNGEVRFDSGLAIKLKLIAGPPVGEEWGSLF